MATGTVELPIEGKLDEYDLVEILSVLESARFDGVLRIGIEGGIWMKDGATYFAESENSPPLADVLFSAKVGPVSQIELSLAESSDVANQLVQQNPSSLRLVSRLILEHTLSSMFELLVPSALTYQIVESESHAIGGLVSTPTSELVKRTMDRVGIWTQIATRIPTTDMVFSLNPELPEGAESRRFGPGEWRYVSLLDGRNTVADLINETGESAFSVCSGLYRLLLEGLVVE